MTYNPIAQNELNKSANGGTENMTRELVRRIDPQILNQFQIHCSRIRERNFDKIQIGYFHDLAQDPNVAKLRDLDYRNSFKKLIFVSDWQLQQYNQALGVEYSKSLVLKNAIIPFDNSTLTDSYNDGMIHIIHHCAPHKSLELVVPIFVELAKHFPNIVLDLYSSFKLYGWSEKDQIYSEIFKICDEHPRINNFGAFPNSEIRTALSKADIFFHPSIFPETSCIALLEAMSAGCLCVHPNYGALPETSGGLTDIYQYSENVQDHANIAYQYMFRILFNYKSRNKNKAPFIKEYVDSLYDWDYRATQWNAVLSQLKDS